MRLIILAVVLLSACSPIRCQQVGIDVLPLESKAKPAGRVVIMCDGHKLTEIHGANVAVPK